jgi:hypothetical protein
MFGRALKRTFWVFYDNFFKGMMLNLLLFIVYFLIFFFMWKQKLYLPTILIIGLLWHVFTPAVMHYWVKLIRIDDHKNMFVELLEGLKLFGLKGAVLFFINTAAAYLVYISIDFYKAHAANRIFLVLGGIGVWLAFTFLLMQLYLIPIMVMDEKRRVLVSYKKSLIMLLSAPFSSILVLFAIAYLEILLYPVIMMIGGPQSGGILVYLSLFPIFLLPFLSIINIILLQLNAAILIYEKHNISPSLKEIWEEKKWSNLFRPWEVK